MKFPISKRRKMSLDSVLKGKSELIPLIDLDPAYIRPRMNYITDKKEEVGIADKNLILQGSDFPADAQEGQVFYKNGKPYIYKGDVND